MPWHDGLQPDDLTSIQGSGWHTLSGDDAAKAIFGSLRNLQKLHGSVQAGTHLNAEDAVHPEEPRRTAFWQKLGRPDKADDYKTEGLTADAGLLTALKGAAHSGNLTQGQFEAMAKPIVEHLTMADQGKQIAEQAAQQTNVANWEAEQGVNLLANKYKINAAITALKASAGADFGPAIEALAKTAGPGYAGVQNMFLALANAMGEGRHVPSDPGIGTGGAGLTGDQARAKLDALQRDAGWRTRVLSGDTVALQQRSDLAAIIAHAMQGA